MLSTDLVKKIEKLSSLTKEDKSILVERILYESELLSDEFLSLLEQKVREKDNQNDNESVNMNGKNQHKNDNENDKNGFKNTNEAGSNRSNTEQITSW